jgi:tRNA-dihydrouridine synthase C
VSKFDLKTAAPKIWLAPMEGVVDPIVRDLWTRTIGGIDYCVSEFIRVTDRLLPDHVFYKIAPEMKTGGATPSGTPVVVQLLGGQCEPMALNAARAIELGAPAIDLNFGCPAKTVNNHDGGAALLKNPHRVFDVTSAVRKAVPAEFTVSAKMRLGFSDKNQFLEIAKAAEEAGASWVTVHARTRDEGYRPPAHWEYTARIREELKIPVIANGEVWTVEDYWRCRDVSGCDHVMIGRGLMSKPDLALAIKKSQPHFEWSDYLQFVRTFAHANVAHRGESYGASRIKQLLKSISRDQPEAAELFNKIKLHHTTSAMTDLAL